ncbi:hypothetical protein Pelo_9922 [Pelomyxa schiedti]|nr:hypothetical protein Pelo_9922 [Pelomyxa schiedti]
MQHPRILPEQLLICTEMCGLVCLLTSPFFFIISFATGNRNDNTCLNKDGKPYTTGTPYCGSATHIGLLEAGQCVDRNGNGKIDTSRNSSHLMVQYQSTRSLKSHL